MTKILVRKKIWNRCVFQCSISGNLALENQIASDGYIYFRTKEPQLDHVAENLVWKKR